MASSTAAAAPRDDVRPRPPKPPADANTVSGSRKPISTGKVATGNVEGVPKCLIWDGEANEDDGAMFPQRFRRLHDGAPPHLEQHFYICDATAPALVHAFKPAEPAISVDHLRKSRLLWKWQRREAAFDLDMERKIQREHKERGAKQRRLQEYQHIQREPLCRQRDHLPPAVSHFRRPPVHVADGEGHANCGGLPHNTAAVATASPRGGGSYKRYSFCTSLK